MGMADEPAGDTEAAPHTGNGTARLDAERAATLQALLAGEHLGEEQPKAPAKPAKPAADPDEDDDLEDEVADSGEDDDDDSDEDDAAEASDEDDDLDDEDDPEDEDDEDEPDKAAAAKRDRALAAIKKQERRSRELIAQERKALDADREAHKAALAEAREIKAALEGARFNLGPLLDKLQFSDEDYEAATRELYARTPAGKKDPKNHDAATRSQRERAQALRIEKLEKRLEEADKARQTEAEKTQASQASAAAADAYMRDVRRAAKTIGAEKAPLFHRALAKNKSAALARISQLASVMIQETNQVPAPRALLRRYEMFRRAELEGDGVDVDALLKQEPLKPQPKDKNQPAGEKRSAKTLDDKGKKSSSKSRREELAETQRLLEAGQLD